MFKFQSFDPNNRQFLCCVAVVLMAGILVVWSFKNKTHANTPIVAQPTVDQKIEIAVKKVWERTKWNTDRLALVACINNHNLSVLKNNGPKTDLIYINEDWTIDRYPDRLSGEELEFIKKFVKSKEKEEE